MDAVQAPPPEGAGTTVRQGYLAVGEGVEVRVRLGEGGAVLTVKGGAGLVRTEVEVPIGAADARALWELTDGRRVEKVRHAFELGEGLVGEVDVYDGPLAGLCTVEVEFASEGAARAFRPPGWFGREVTGDPRWSNAALAVDGRPE